MSERKDGGPAFPAAHIESEPGIGAGIVTHGGMSLRDYFAAKALQGLTLGVSDPEGIEEDARVAYKYADAMLVARERQ